MLHALEAQRPDIHRRWETLLRVEPVNTPLGQPEALKHMVNYTLDTLFGALHTPQARRRLMRSNASCAAERSLCPCGRNPLLAYFVAGEQALLETLILVQASLPESAENRATDVQELKQTLAHVAHREIETFCAVCQFRDQPPGAHSAAVAHPPTHAHHPTPSTHNHPPRSGSEGRAV